MQDVLPSVKSEHIQKEAGKLMRESERIKNAFLRLSDGLESANREIETALRSKSRPLEGALLNLPPQRSPHFGHGYDEAHDLSFD